MGLPLAPNEEEKHSSYMPDNFFKQERQTMLSKNSLQILTYNEFMLSKELVPLNFLPVSHYHLFETPLKDKDQLKRVVLFSDNPSDEQIYSA